ncbi:unnamed protein product [Victoria cruziana]
MEVGKKPPSPKHLIDAKGFPSFFKTRRTMVFAYGFMVAFILCTGFLALGPSVNSFWFSHFSFRTNSPISSSSSSTTSSHSLPFSSIFSYIFPDSNPSSANLDAPEKEGSFPSPSPSVSVPSIGSALKSPTHVKNGDVSGNQTRKICSPPPLSSLVGQVQNGDGSSNKTVQTIKVRPVSPETRNRARNTSAPLGRSDSPAKSPAGSGSLVANAVKNVTVSSNKTLPVDNNLHIPSPPNNGSQDVLLASGGVRRPSNNGGVSSRQFVGQEDNGGNLTNVVGVGASLQCNISSSGNRSNSVEKTSVSDGKNKQPSSPPVPPAKDVIGPGNTSFTVIATPVKDSSNPPANLVGKLIGNGKSTEKSNGTPTKPLEQCNIFDGRWVKDDSHPLYPPGSCPFIDESFDCYLNGRPDRQYEKWRWQPKNCNIPRLDPGDMLQRLRGKRLVFIGDSLNRNMWESLVCTLRNYVKDKKKVFEVSGRREFKTEGSYAINFRDYDCSVEFIRSPFLVQEWGTPEPNGSTKETLRLDLIEKSSSKYKNADILVFNTGHWWTHEKTSKGKDYYQEGNHVYSELDVHEAYRKALKTWAKWVDTYVDPKKTLVFFRGYSSSHFSGGQWNSGGQCDNETEPILMDAYLNSYPPKMKVLESVLNGMRTPISYLNITRMTDYRKDAHPSIYRKQNLTDEERRAPERFQDCSHWCLPGLPDTWNELLYAKLVMMGK